MKNLIYTLSIIIISTLTLFAQNETLRGDKAVEHLKQTGQYDSLMDAVRDARKDNGQIEEPQPDDVIGQTAKLTALDGETGDQLGVSVSISGDTAIVGAYTDDVVANPDQGSAYVFIRSGAVWTQQAQLIASDGEADDQFGIGVAISGDTAIVGAYQDDFGANTNQGSAYIFTRSGTVWTQQAKLTAADGAEYDDFGFSVSIDGDTVIIGVYNDDVGANIEQGSAFVFTRSGTVWTQQAQLFAADGEATDQFGYSVSIDGETVIVGSLLDDVGANTDQGSVYVFTRSGAVWIQQAQLNASDGEVTDQFGVSLAIDGDTVIVGAWQDDVGANTDQGSAYVFVRSGTVWTQQQQLTAIGGEVIDFFGYSVAISGNTAIVGAFGDDVGANTDRGSAYVFTRSGIVWTQQAQLFAADGTIFDQFGWSVAISGNNMIVGAYLDDVGANADQGSTYVYRVLVTTWTQEAQKVASDGTDGDQLGYSVAIDGDTAIVSAATDDVGGNNEQGSAYIFVRSGTTWTEQAQLIASDGGGGDFFGYSVAISGNTAVVGAINHNVGVNSFQGSAYVFTRSGAVWTEQAKLIASDGVTLDGFGASVAISGDTAIVGAYGDDVGANIDQGSAYIFTRSGTVWSQQTQLNGTGGADQDLFGWSVAIDGDTAIVGAIYDDVGVNSFQGSAFVFTRSGATWSQQTQLIASDGEIDDLFGNSVSISGNTAIIGAYGDTVGANGTQGSAYVFVRSGATWTQQAQLIAADGADGDLFGNSISVSGETAVISSPYKDVGANTDQGSAYVFVRSGGVWTQQDQLTISDSAMNDIFGFSVAISGDKIIVGAPGSDVSVNVPLAPQAAEQGAVFIFVNNLAPTASSVSVGGRILAANGIGVRNAIVSATLANGEVRTTRSSSFGYYNFDDLEAGQTVVVSVISKRFQFASQVVTLNESISELDFWAQ